jgi:hypothetical protein
MKRIGGPVAVALMLATATPAFAGSLTGSHSSMVHQHAIAEKLDYTFSRTPAQLKALVADSALHPVLPNADFTLSGVSYPFARPEVGQFIARLAAEYHAATGTKLVVTSLARPISLQPKNASPLSVHPAGMAVDLRVPASDKDRTWLQNTLLALENRGVLDVTREHIPSHFHVAIFPTQYRAYAATQDSTLAVAAERAAATALAAPIPAAGDAAASNEASASAGEKNDLPPDVFVLSLAIVATVLGASVVHRRRAAAITAGGATVAS